jgi:hypothetical protein
VRQRVIANLGRAEALRGFTGTHAYFPIFVRLAGARRRPVAPGGDRSFDCLALREELYGGRLYGDTCIFPHLKYDVTREGSGGRRTDKYASVTVIDKYASVTVI